jgi:hypothetical protein
MASASHSRTLLVGFRLPIIDGEAVGRLGPNGLLDSDLSEFSMIVDQGVDCHRRFQRGRLYCVDDYYLRESKGGQR